MELKSLRIWKKLFWLVVWFVLVAEAMLDTLLIFFPQLAFHV
jgi:hypothetical protein